MQSKENVLHFVIKLNIKFCFLTIGSTQRGRELNDASLCFFSLLVSGERERESLFSQDLGAGWTVNTAVHSSTAQCSAVPMQCSLRHMQSIRIHAGAEQLLFNCCITIVMHCLRQLFLHSRSPDNKAEMMNLHELVFCKSIVHGKLVDWQVTRFDCEIRSAKTFDQGGGRGQIRVTIVSIT